MSETLPHEGATVDKNEIVCASCGMEWEEEMGINDFGCWSCGNMRSVNVSPAEAIAMMDTYNQSQRATTNKQTKEGNK